MSDISKEERKDFLKILQKDWVIKRDSEGNIVISEEDLLRLVKSFVRGGVNFAEELMGEK